jgi:hypothetical protein
MNDDRPLPKLRTSVMHIVPPTFPPRDTSVSVAEDQVSLLEEEEEEETPSDVAPSIAAPAPSSKQSPTAAVPKTEFYIKSEPVSPPNPANQWKPLDLQQQQQRQQQQQQQQSIQIDFRLRVRLPEVSSTKQRKRARQEDDT